MSDRVFATNLDEAMKVIDQFGGEPLLLKLVVPEALFGISQIGDQLATGAGAALIADRALARGWMPSGFEVVGDNRVWSFAEF